MGTGRVIFRAGRLAAAVLAGALSACDGVGRDSAPALAPAPLISRADLFGDPARAGGQLSPRGDRVAFLAPHNGAMNLWVLSVDALADARPLTDDAEVGVRGARWAFDNQTVLFFKDETHSGAQRLFAVDSAAGSDARALTPAGVNARIVGLSASDPAGVIVALGRNAPDLYRIDISNGARTLVFRNPGDFIDLIVDKDNQLRLGLRRDDDGGYALEVRTPDGGWRTLASVPVQDALSSRPLSVLADGRSVLMLDSTGRDRAALVQIDIESGAKAVLGESVRADVVAAWLNPATSAPEAWAVEYLRREWRGLDQDAAADLEFLDRQLVGDFTVVSRDANDTRWIVVEDGPATPPRSYLYDRTDRAGRRLTLLFRHYPALEQAPLQPMAPVEIDARDGLTLVSYLTLPIGSDANGDGRPEMPAPLVLLPHDGPHQRDSFGFNPMHQWLANRGYAVMSVNFRGSTGFGTAFLNAANGAWGGRVLDDIADAAQWAVDNGVAQSDRVAIVGAGFGGFAALSAAAREPDRYRCAASYGAPVNLASWVEAAEDREGLYQRAGDPRTAIGRQTLREQSPLSFVGQIRGPVLLALGARSPFTPRIETDVFAQSLRARRNPLTYLVFPDEGRELARQANRGAYLAVLEHFLGDCLGGRVEPVGASFEGANLEALDGAVNVPGLSAFARRPTPRTLNPRAPANAPAAEPAEETLQNPPRAAVPD